MPNKSFNQILDEHLHILIAQGNHEAYQSLNKRYHKHASLLCTNLLRQYPDTGISKKELLSLCEAHFLFVVTKYTNGLSRFYSFWKESTSQMLMDYLIENSYEGDSFVYKGIVSFDQNSDDRHCFGDLIGERDDEKALIRKAFEMKGLINKFGVFFTGQEKALLNLILEGYTLPELEHSGMLRKSYLYLTYKSAISKLHNLLRKSE